MGVTRRTIFCIALISGIPIGAGVVAWQRRQRDLDARLLSALAENRLVEARSHLEAGADPNAVYTVTGDRVVYDRHPARGQRGKRRVPFVWRLTATELLFRSAYLPGRRVERRLTPETTSVLKYLLERGADPDRVYGPVSPLMTAVRLRRYDDVRLLLTHGAHPDAPSPLDETPLMEADAECARLLLDSGARLDRRDRQGMTPLMFAAAHDPEAVRLLIRKGARLNDVDRYGQTPLMHAATDLAIRLLLEAGANVNAQQSDGQTMLMLAVRQRRPSATIALLLRFGADASIRDATGDTALDIARSCSYRPALEILTQFRSAGRR